MKYNEHLIVRLIQWHGLYSPKDYVLSYLMEFLRDGFTTNRDIEWLLSSDTTSRRSMEMYGNRIIIKKIDNEIHLGDIYDNTKTFTSYFHAKNTLFVQAIKGWIEICNIRPEAIDVFYDGTTINFVASRSDCVAMFVNNENHYESIKITSPLSYFLASTDMQDIAHIKQLVMNRSQQRYNNTETSLMIDDAMITIWYANKLFSDFGMSFEKSIFLTMLDDWQQILENKPSKVDVFYDGKTVWFETE